MDVYTAFQQRMAQARAVAPKIDQYAPGTYAGQYGRESGTTLWGRMFGAKDVTTGDLEAKRILAFLRSNDAAFTRRNGQRRDAKTPFDSTDLAMQAIARAGAVQPTGTGRAAMFGQVSMLGGVY